MFAGICFILFLIFTYRFAEAVFGKTAQTPIDLNETEKDIAYLEELTHSTSKALTIYNTFNDLGLTREANAYLHQHLLADVEVDYE